MALPVYSSRDVTIAYGGQTLEGLMPDAFVTFSYNTDRTDEEVGADSQVNISLMPDLTGTCTISLQQNSPSNLVLSGVQQLQRIENRLIVASLVITDPSGSVLANLKNCHLKTTPEITLGNTATGQSRDWVFYVEELDFTSTPEGAAGLLPEEVAAIASAVQTITSI